MYNWFEAEFRRRGKRPTREECYKTGRELHGLTRSGTRELLRSHPEWTRDTPPSVGRHPRQLRLWSGGQIDLGFLNVRGKHYGMFFLGKWGWDSSAAARPCAAAAASGRVPGFWAVRRRRVRGGGPPAAAAFFPGGRAHRATTTTFVSSNELLFFLFRRQRSQPASVCGTGEIQILGVDPTGAGGHATLGRVQTDDDPGER